MRRTLGDFVKAFEAKPSRGAKPGKRGILPGSKVTEEVSEFRGILPGRDSISPNRHRDIGNMEELIDFIARWREHPVHPYPQQLGAALDVVRAVGLGWPGRNAVQDAINCLLRGGV
jgi:hypothetical protein